MTYANLVSEAFMRRSGLEDHITIKPDLPSNLTYHQTKMTDKIMVLSTCATEADAERLARALVAGRFAACVNVLPGVRSFYHWKGEIESSQEFLLLVKTSRDLFPA